ncbi:MAG: hypothetical protein JWQ38_2646, partial [Flavipsychrobacter sp.]|nr:hypothetical protein [Flavipsychrobacter sp.]
MKQANEITDELRSMGSTLADLPRTMPYAIPSGYFSALAGGIRTTITDINEKEDIPEWSKKMPFIVPANYFNTLAEEITSKSFAASLPNATLFAVPQGYFNNLPTLLLQAAKTADAEKTATIISLKRTNIFKQLRWAAAAILVMGIGFVSYNFYQASQITDTDNLLASVPASELQDYVQGMYRIDIDHIVSSNNDVSNMQLDNKDIIQYLNET